MKLTITAAALLLAVPAYAQNSAPVTTPMPAAPAAPATPAAAPAMPAATALGLDTPIATLVENPAAHAVLDADLPGMLQHPSFEQFKMLTLNQLAPYSQGLLTPELLTQVAAHLAAIH